jgi:hypothetical protein
MSEYIKNYITNVVLKLSKHTSVNYSVEIEWNIVRLFQENFLVHSAELKQSFDFFAGIDFMLKLLCDEKEKVDKENQENDT